MGRRILYQHYLLTRPTSEMIYNFFEAQLNKPVKNDWTEQVKEDLVYLELNYSNEDIKNFKKENFLKKVKKQIRKIAFRDLTSVIPNEKNENKRILTKMKNLKYSNLELQDYLKNSLVNSKYAKQIFKYRTRMTKVGNNFKNSGKNECPLCFKNVDSQEHLIDCENNILDDIEIIEYENIFSENTSEILSTVKVLVKAMEEREDKLN